MRSIYTGIVQGRQDQDVARARQQSLDIQARQADRADAQAAQQQQTQAVRLQTQQQSGQRQQQANMLLKRASFLEAVADPDMGWPDIQDQYGDILKAGKFRNIAEDAGGNIMFATQQGTRIYKPEALRKKAQDYRLQAAMFLDPNKTMAQQQQGRYQEGMLGLRKRQIDEATIRSNKEQALKSADAEDRKLTRREMLRLQGDRNTQAQQNAAAEQEISRKRLGLDRARLTTDIARGAREEQKLAQESDDAALTREDRKTARKYDRARQLQGYIADLIDEKGQLLTAIPKVSRKQAAEYEARAAEIDKEIAKVRKERKAELGMAEEQDEAPAQGMTEETYIEAFKKSPANTQKRPPTAKEIEKAREKGIIVGEAKKRRFLGLW